MERIRNPFQGVFNIIRFNWYFYIVSIILLVITLVLSNYFFSNYSFYINILCLIAISPIFISLIVSYYVYDLSDLYNLDRLNKSFINEDNKVFNINAGFDETTILLKDKYPKAEIIVFDFYDETKHTEISIKRARKSYPPYPNTKHITTTNIPLENNTVNAVLLILSAHEIRSYNERTTFFKELNRILRSDGKIILTEHLRDIPNFLAYNIGSFHFHSRNAWLKNIHDANLHVKNELKITPFITTFTLEKNGDTS